MLGPGLIDRAIGTAGRTVGFFIPEKALQRFTITVDDELIEALDTYMKAGGHKNRSEAVRDLVWAGLRDRVRTPEGSRECVAALVYTYEPETRQLASRLTTEYFLNADLFPTRTSIGIDAETCLEVSLLRGTRSRIEKFSQEITDERGVRYEHLAMVPCSLKP